MNDKVKYNIPIEVPDQNTYNILMSESGKKGLAGIIAGRKENGKFYIKLMLIKYKQLVTEILEELKVI